MLHAEYHSACNNHDFAGKRRRLPGAGGSMDGGLVGGRGEQKN